MTKVYWEDVEVGHVAWGAEVIADKSAMLDYARRYDPFPFHVDEAAASETPFGGLIASGGYAISLWYLSGQDIWNRNGRTWAFLGGFDWRVRFLVPVRPGDRLRNKWTLLEKIPSRKPGRGMWKNLNELTNQDDQVALSIESMVMMTTRPASPA
jgi:acyl dehydratase